MAVAVAAWTVALVLASGGLAVSRSVLDRGVAYGEATAATPRDVTIRAVNAQLEMEPDLADVARALDMATAAGFGWVRQQVSWADLEPGHKGNFWDYANDRPTWARWDAIARLASDRGLRVIARLELPPEWSRPPGSYKSHPPTNVHDYADFVAAFTSRYRGVVDHVQLWNEPNLAEEWGRRPVDAAAYVELLRAGFEGARRGNSRATVVGASLAQTLEPDLEGAAGLDDLVFLDRMYRHGAARFMDVVAANGYGLWTGPEDRTVGSGYTNLARLLLVRDVMARHGDAAKALWVSEFGWNAQPDAWEGRPSPWGRVDEATQAAYLMGAYRRAAREWPWMGPMAAWLLRQPRASADDPTPFFALVREDWSTRPAYDALVADARAPVLGPGTWGDGAPGLEYVGTWQRTALPVGTLHETPAPNAHLRLRFEGTRLELVAPVGPTRGLAYVTVDGSYLLAGQLPRNRFGQATIDFGATIARDAVRFPVASGLPDGLHRVELTVSGDAGSGSSAPGVGIDGIVVARDRSSMPEAVLAVAGGLTVATGAWATRHPVRLLAARAGAAVAALAPPSAVTAARQVDVGEWASLLLLATLPLAALGVPAPGGRYSPVELGALLAIALAAGREWLRAGRPRPYRLLGAPRLAWLDGDGWAAFLLLAGGTLGACIAAYPNPAWREWRLLVVEPVAWYVVARPLARTPSGARRLAAAMVAGAALAGSLAVLQSVTGWGVIEAEGIDRARALSTSPNNLALLLGRVLPVAVALALSAGPRRRLAWAAVAAVGIGLVATQSRGGWVAGAVALAVLGARLAGAARPAAEATPAATDEPAGRDGPAGAPALPVGQANRRRSRRVLAVVAVVALALGLVATTGRWSTALRDDGTGLLRLSVWRSAVQMLRDHPVTGLGLDQFVYTYPAYLQPGAWREPNLSHPHQIVLDAWLRLGAFGPMALAALAWGTWRRDRRAARDGAGDATLRHGAIAALVAVAVHGLVDNSYFVLDLAYATWAIVLVHRGASGGSVHARRPPD